MLGAVLHGIRDVRVDSRAEPILEQPTDAIIRVRAASICGSDLWDYRGPDPVDTPIPLGHEYIGVVEDIGNEVQAIKTGQFVVGSFAASDNTCEMCRAGYHSRCRTGEYVGAGGAQAEYLRVPLADGTLVSTPEVPSDDLLRSLLTASDVLGTGWFGATAADVRPGKVVVVIGDGAVGLLSVLASAQLGADQIILVSSHSSRHQIATSFGATDIITARGDEAVAAVRQLTRGLGAHSVIEAVGTQESILQAVQSTRPGGHLGHLGLPNDSDLPMEELFAAGIHLHGGSAPVRRFLPNLIDLILQGEINPGLVIDSTLPLDQAARGYELMLKRTSIKAMLLPPRN